MAELSIQAQIIEAHRAEAERAAFAVKERARLARSEPAPCAGCLELKGVRPCSVECYVAAGYKAESFAAFVADKLTPQEREAKLKAEAEAEATARAEAQAKIDEAAKIAEEARVKAEADDAALKATEAAELAALEAATRPDEAPLADSADDKSGKRSKK